MQAVSARGNIITDARGLEWLDMRSGIMNVSLGHGSQVVQSAILEAHESGLINSYKAYSKNYYALKELLHYFAPDYQFEILNTGAEAIDRALQIVAMQLGRMPVIGALRGGFHGKTMPFSIMRHPDQPWGNPFNIVQFDLDDIDIPDFDVLIYEPVMNLIGSVPDEDRILEICTAREAYIIADEMITAFFRVGERFESTIADIVVAAKGLAQGLPLSVIGINTEIFESTDIPVEWSTTASGNNLCCTVGLRVLQHFIDEEAEIQYAVGNIERMMQAAGLKARGALGFLECKDAKELAAALHDKRILATARDGLLRVGPSFITTQEEINILAEAIGETKWQ